MAAPGSAGGFEVRHGASPFQPPAERGLSIRIPGCLQLFANTLGLGFFDHKALAPRSPFLVVYFLPWRLQFSVCALLRENFA